MNKEELAAQFKGVTVDEEGRNVGLVTFADALAYGADEREAGRAERLTVSLADEHEQGYERGFQEGREAKDACWHCGIVLEPRPRPRCESCPDECDIEGCDAFGCRAPG